MIDDVDAALRTLIRREAANGSDVEVAFDAPTREWAGRRTSPTIDVYLFDIREDLPRRRVEFERVVDDEGLVVGRRRPPRRYRLSYLVTAWTQRPEDEHRLLSGVLRAFLPHEQLPDDVLDGGLAEQPLPVFVSVGLPPPAERSIGEIWNAMGGELKPSLELVVSAPFPIDDLQPVGPPVREQPRLSIDGGDGRVEEAPGVPAGDGDAGPEAAEHAPGISETVRGGTEDGAGRMITITTIER